MLIVIVSIRMEKTGNLPPLRDAEKMVTRFPPQANASLHLGHLKALLLNYLYAKKYNGKIILRFDDTNPEKEKIEYEKSICDDIHMLGLDCDEVTYASDYFDQIIDCAFKLISMGLAYIDFTDADTINSMRLELKPSAYRDSLANYNELCFRQMVEGKLTNCCLRAKIDYESKNGCMRDPVIFRYKNSKHPRHGDKYKIYPTYDFACPILDSLQGVTHAMRSVEYKDRDSQYQWFLTNLDLKHNTKYPIISDYGKLSFSHSVLSKRKLTKLVDNELVDGWSDPRLPTIRGIIRRGINIIPLIDYIKTQITSGKIVNLGWEKLYSFNLSYLDKTCCRIYGISPNQLIVKLDGDYPKSVTIPNHPKDKSFGMRHIDVTPELIVDAEVGFGIELGKRFTLIGLGNAVVTSINPITLQYNALDCDYKNTTKVTWLPNDVTNIPVKVRRYGHLLSKPKLENNDDIVDLFNKNSLDETTWLVEKSIKSFTPGTAVQIMRYDYCFIDRSDINGIIMHAIPNK